MEQKVRIYNDLDVLACNSADDRLNIEGFAAHFGRKNLNGEIVFAESFNMFFEAYGKGQIKPVLNFEHQGDKQIGGIDEIVREKDGLYVRAHINRSIPYCAEWLIPNIMAGDINKLSSEGIIVGGRDGVTVNSDGSYTVMNFLLTAVAVVKHPADWDAEFTVANYLKTVPEEEAREDIERSKWYLL